MLRKFKTRRSYYDSHIKTEKGKGYKFAEKSEDKYHGVSKFNVNTGVQEKAKSNGTFVHQSFCKYSY